MGYGPWLFKAWEKVARTVDGVRDEVDEGQRRDEGGVVERGEYPRSGVQAISVVQAPGQAAGSLGRGQTHAWYTRRADQMH